MQGMNAEDPAKPTSLPPGAWAPARALALRIMRPVEQFLHVQAASGIRVEP